MKDSEKVTCPKCNKELKWIPRGTHLCSCGETVVSNGHDLEEFDLRNAKLTFSERFSLSWIEIVLLISIICIIGIRVLFVIYNKQIRDAEAGLISTIFGVDRLLYREFIGPALGLAVITIWLGYKLVKRKI